MINKRCDNQIDIEPGTKVLVKAHWNWPNDCSGAVEEPPEYVRQLVADDCPWHGVTRTVEGREGPITFVWIKFDTPQLDGDDNGPYRGGEVEMQYVKLLT